MISISGHNYSSTAMAGSSIQNKIDTSIQRLSSGQRINAAKDDVAGMQISMRLNADIKGLEQASKNAADVQSLIDTAEGSMKESTSILLRVRELAVQSANGTSSAEDRAALDNEVQVLLKANDRIASKTSWAGIKLLDGTFSNRNMMIGNGISLSVSISGTSSSSLGISAQNYSVHGSIATSSHPGQNNSNDVTIHGLRPGTDIENYIQLNPDTTNGMNANLSTTNIDNSLDTKTKVEILGVEYTLDPGTTEEKNTQLSQFLTADGISNSIGTDGSGLQIVLVNSSTLSDYAAAYGSDTFEIHANPLNNSDGKSNDAIWSNDSPTFNSNYSVPALVSGYTKPDVSALRSSTTTTTSSSSSSSHPGANNSTDVSIIANHPTNSTNLYFIKFTDDTTAGMVHWYSNGGGIDPTDDPNSKVEILGKEYTVAQGTVAAKTANLQAQLAADGVSATVRDAGNPWGTLLEVDATTLNDYITAYGTNSFVLYADPLNVVDGSSNDGDLTSGGFVQLVSGYTNTSNSTANNTIDNTPQKIGYEFQVNTFTNGDQNSSPIPAQSVTALANGDFVVAWDSEDQDGSGKGAFAQIFSSDGTKKGSEFQVNSGTQNNQEHPTVTALDDGGFIIAFMSYGQDGESSNYTNSYAQRYDASGATIGSQFILHNNSDQYQHMPVVTALDNGKFVATWQAQYTNQYKIYSRIFDSNNTPTGVEFMVNTSTSGMQHHADTVKLKNGDFVVSWVDTGQQSTGIYGQRFDSTGNKLGGEFQVNSYTVLDQQEPALTALDDGGFVVSWQSNGQDGDGYGIFAQRYDASGNTVGSEFQVNTTTSNSQEFSTGVGLSDGGFLIAWTSNLQDGSGYGVFGQRFDQNGGSVGNEFQINTYTTNDQDRISLAQLANGNVIATWDSNGQDGSGDGVFAQILDVSINNSSNTTSTTTNSSTIPTIENIDSAIEKLNSHRASLGALSNRLDNIMAVNVNTSINLKRAKGLITDANFAQETADLAKNNILQQTSIQMDVLSRKAGDSLRTLLNGDSFVYKQNFLY